MFDNIWKVIVFGFICIPFAVWKWVEIIVWLVKHISVSLH